MVAPLSTFVVLGVTLSVSVAVTGATTGANKFSSGKGSGIGSKSEPPAVVGGALSLVASGPTSGPAATAAGSDFRPAAGICANGIVIIRKEFRSALKTCRLVPASLRDGWCNDTAVNC